MILETQQLIIYATNQYFIKPIYSRHTQRRFIYNIFAVHTVIRNRLEED